MPAPRDIDAFLGLADTTRRQILRLLCGGPLGVLELTNQLPVRQPTVSAHLAVLKKAGLVQMKVAGRRRIYALHAEGVRRVRQFVEMLGSVPATSAPPVAPQPASSPPKDDWAVWD